MKLEELTVGASVKGILPDALVTVVSAQWFGSEALELSTRSIWGGPPSRWLPAPIYFFDVQGIQHMAITNHERVGKALDLFKTGLAPYVEREIKNAVQTGVLSPQAAKGFIEEPHGFEAE